MAKTATAAPAAPAGDEELFDQVMTATTAADFEAAPTEPPPAEEPPAQDKPHERIPLSELLDERDRRRAAEDRLQQYEARERQQQQQPIDPIMRPDEYFDKRFNEALDPIRRQFTMQIAAAHKALAVQIHGAEAVEEAQKAFDLEVQQGRMHPLDNARVFSQPNPFQAAVEWNNQRKFAAEVGNDPKLYRDRILTEALADPEFLGRALEAARAQAAGRPVTVAPQQRRASAAPAQVAGRAPLPPSLNRQGPPGGAPTPALGEMDDADLYSEMTSSAKFME